MKGVFLLVVGDGRTTVGDVEGAEVRAVPVEDENHPPFVHIVAVFPVRAPGIEGENAILGNGKVAEPEEVVAGVGDRMPHPFACLPPALDGDAGAGEVYFIHPVELHAVDVADVQATVLHVGAGDAGGGRVGCQAVAGIENAFQAVAEVGGGAVRVGDAELVCPAFRFADAIPALGINAGGDDAVTGTHGSQRDFAVGGEVGELRGIAGLAALLQVDFHQPPGAEVEGGDGVTLPVEGQVVHAFPCPVARRDKTVHFAGPGVVNGKPVGAFGGEDNEEGIRTDDFGRVDDVQVREVEAFRAAEFQGACLGMQQRRGFRCDVRGCLAAGNT